MQPTMLCQVPLCKRIPKKPPPQQNPVSQIQHTYSNAHLSKLQRHLRLPLSPHLLHPLLAHHLVRRTRQPAVRVLRLLPLAGSHLQADGEANGRQDALERPPGALARLLRGHERDVVSLVAGEAQPAEGACQGRAVLLQLVRDFL